MHQHDHSTTSNEVSKSSPLHEQASSHSIAAYLISPANSTTRPPSYTYEITKNSPQSPASAKNQSPNILDKPAHTHIQLPHHHHSHATPLRNGHGASAHADKHPHSLLQYIQRTVHVILSVPSTRKIFLYLLLNISFMFVEVVVGWWCNSLGLIGDGVHMLFDSSAILLGLWASVVSRWDADEFYSYGYVVDSTHTRAFHLQTPTLLLKHFAWILLLFNGLTLIWIHWLSTCLSSLFLHLVILTVFSFAYKLVLIDVIFMIIHAISIHAPLTWFHAVTVRVH